MARKYNPDTKYGRKKLRDEFQYRYNNEMTPQERSDNDFWSGAIIIGIFIVICTVAYACCGVDGLRQVLK